MTGYVIEPGSDYAKEDCLLGETAGGAGDYSTRGMNGASPGTQSQDTSSYKITRVVC